MRKHFRVAPIPCLQPPKQDQGPGVACRSAALDVLSLAEFRI